jgi:hypothetical protein
MPEPESNVVYDRESEFTHDETRSGRRRRPVADWGGDELFTRMPRRRADHAGPRSRRFVREEDELAAAPPLDEWDGADPAPASPEPPLDELERQAEHEPPIAEREPRRSEAAERVAERGPARAGGVPGRRTVVIGRSGRPEFPSAEAPFVSVSRRRPPQTVAERIGGQPERIVAWAFALGMLLILIAILTANS